MEKSLVFISLGVIVLIGIAAFVSITGNFSASTTLPNLNVIRNPSFEYDDPIVVVNNNSQGYPSSNWTTFNKYVGAGVSKLNFSYSKDWSTNGVRSFRISGVSDYDGISYTFQRVNVPSSSTQLYLKVDLRIASDSLNSDNVITLCPTSSNADPTSSCQYAPDIFNSENQKRQPGVYTLTIPIASNLEGIPVEISLQSSYKAGSMADIYWDNVKITQV